MPGTEPSVNLPHANWKACPLPQSSDLWKAVIYSKPVFYSSRLKEDSESFLGPDQTGESAKSSTSEWDESDKQSPPSNSMGLKIEL